MVRNVTRLEILLLATAILAAQVGLAEEISVVGEVLNQPNWHSTTTAKPFTVPGAGTYGQDGYVFFGVTNESQGNTAVFGENFVASNDNGATVFQDASFTSGLPSFVTSFSPGADYSNTAWNFGPYASADDPRLPAAPAVADAQIGGIVSPTNQAVGSFQELLTFTLGNDVPDVLRLGIANGSISSAFFTPTAIQLDGPNDSELIAVTDAIANATDTQLNWTFFDIEGGAPGDVFSISAQVRNRPGTGNDRAAISAITFDAVVPEPGSMAICGLLTCVGFGGYCYIRRRDRRVPQ